MKHWRVICVVLWFTPAVFCAVLMDTGGEFKDYGHTLQFKG